MYALLIFLFFFILILDCTKEKFPQLTEEEFNLSLTKHFYYVKDKLAKINKEQSVSEPGPSTSLQIRN